MRIVVVIILTICFAGCSSKQGLPSGILQSEKMQAVLWDVIIAEAYTTEFIKKDSLKNTQIENAKLQQQIFAIHKISKKEFYDSYNYYSNHVDLMKTLLDSITTKGEREKEKTLYSKPIIPMRKPVSLMPPPILTPPKLIIIPMPIPTQIQVQDSTPVINARPVFNVRPRSRPTP